MATLKDEYHSYMTNMSIKYVLYLYRLYHDIFCIASSMYRNICIPPERSKRLQQREAKGPFHFHRTQRAFSFVWGF